MNFKKFIETVNNLPVIDTELLFAGISNSGAIKVQISRWKKTGKLIQLKRGIYLLAEPYRKINVFEPYIASLLKRPSYISLEKALEYHGLIPEAVNIYTSVTTKRQAQFINETGIFNYRHIQTALFWGYKSLQVDKQTAFMALPEKGLLDLLYLNHINISLDYFEELRLQNVENINFNRLFEYARRFNNTKILNAAKIIKEYAQSYQQGEKIL
ncbi:MAG: hypothetical protein KAT05_05485 [Spirochaetes bacterium]|nr:hypothetical protein [Spirochaetota bacterium]